MVKNECNTSVVVGILIYEGNYSGRSNKMRLDDEYFIQRCLNGDSSAFGFLVDKYKACVYALAYSKLRNFHDAEDITQEAFVKAYRGLRTLRRWDDFSIWLHAITANLCKMFIRGKSRRIDSEFIEDQDPKIFDEFSLEEYHDNLTRESVHDALDSLPEMYQQVLTLYYLGGMNSMEIAKFLCIPPTTIRQRLSRARLQLKEGALSMMSEIFEQQQLKASFTFRIVEVVKRIRVNPFSQTKSLPWGLSLATGILFAVLGLHTNLSLFNINDMPADSLLSSQTIVQKVGDFPVKALRMSQLLDTSGNLGNGKSDFSGQQNFAFMAPKGEGGKIPDKPSTQIGKGSLGGIAYSSDSNILAILTGLGVRLYDANNLNEIGMLQEDKPYFNRISISHDGRLLAVVNYQEGVSLWDAQMQKLISSISESLCYDMALSPDGKVLATIGESDYKNIHLWDTQSLKRIGSLKGHTDYISSIAFTPDGKTLVSASYSDNTIRVWSVQEQKQIGFLNGNKNPTNRIAISPDGKILASGGKEGELLLWDIQEQKLIGSLEGHNSWVNSVAFSSNGEILASSDDDQTIHIWNVQEQKQIALIQIDKGDGNMIAFNPDGKTLASTNLLDQTVRFWDIQEQKQTGIIDGFAYAGFAAFSPDSKTIAYGAYKTVFWDVANQKQIGEGVPTDSSFQKIAFSPDGKIVAGACIESIYLIDVQSQKQIGLLKGHTQFIQSIAFSPDSKLLASGSLDMTLRLWDVQQQKEVWMNNCPSHTHSVAFTPDGKYVASAIGGEGAVRIWNVKTKNEIEKFQVPGAAMSIAISPDGKLLACGSRDTVTIWDFDKRKQLGVVSVGDNELIWNIMFSPDNNWLASTSNDATCHIWDVNTLEQLADLKGHKGGIINIFFSSNGKWLATSGSEGTILLWEVDIPVQNKAVNPTGKFMGTWGDVKKDQLFQNYPNPFNPETWIPYQLGKDTESEIKIYTSNGQLVRKLDLGQKQAGSYINQENAAYWDGRNDAGECVSSGVYYYSIQAGEYSATKKMIVVR